MLQNLSAFDSLTVEIPKLNIILVTYIKNVVTLGDIFWVWILDHVANIGNKHTRQNINKKAQNVL